MVIDKPAASGDAGNPVWQFTAVHPEKSRNDMKISRRFLVALPMLAAIHVHAVDPVSVYTQGGADPAALACGTCHGPEGEGIGPAGFPRLAGLSAEYMKKQLADFASGSRANPVMQPIAAALSAEEADAVSRMLAAKPGPDVERTGRAAAVSGVGDTLALRGAWEHEIPACVACHGPGGAGVGDAFPPLAGQSAPYLSTQLEAWRQGTRNNDPDDLMGHIARDLTDDEIEAVARYFADPSGTASADAAATANPSPDLTNTGDRAGDPHFRPPLETELADDEFGRLVQEGRALFVDTGNRAPEFVGNGLSCGNCHLDQGRRADSAPLWAAYGMYPAYRSKNEKVNSYVERIQGCFRFSMNGKVPPADGPVIAALSAYSYWLSTGAPIGRELPGRGYPQVPEPEGGYDLARGERIYRSRCALCHGENGEGQRSGGDFVFPPLWGPESFNGGAGMHRIHTAAAFIQANMPLGKGGTLSDQDAGDVAAFMNRHERPEDPRLQDR